MTHSDLKPKEKDLSKIRYIISDWDGTLVDSMPTYSQAYSKLMEAKFGVDPAISRPYYLSTAGTALTDQIKNGVKNFAGVQLKNTLELENQFWNFQVDTNTPEIIEGAREALKKLKKMDLVIIVWSGTRSDVLTNALKRTGLEKFISFSVGNEPGSSTRVKGQGLIHEIANHLQIPLSTLVMHSLVIGDGIGDIRAGKDINCPTVGILKTQTEEQFQSEGADFIIDKISDLPALLVS